MCSFFWDSKGCVFWTFVVFVGVLAVVLGID